MSHVYVGLYAKSHAYDSEGRCVLLSFDPAQTYKRAPWAHIACKSYIQASCQM